MSKKLQLRGGTTTEHASFTGAVREVTVDTDKDTLVIHDGSTAGGFALPRTDAEIRTAVEAATDSNVFTDADHSKLNAIEASADVTDTVNVVAALTAGSNITIASDGTIAGAAQYTHPTHPGDDAGIDTGALSGATVISDLDFNITTDTLGHVTDANATVGTRNLTLGNLGYSGATNANYITNNNQLSNGSGFVTSSSFKTVNGNTVTGSGDIEVGVASPDWDPSTPPNLTITTTSTWTRPSNIPTWIIVYMVGGGGYGSFYPGFTGWSQGGAGGGAAVFSGYGSEFPSTIAFTVGAGGVGGSSSGTASGATSCTINGVYLVGRPGAGIAYNTSPSFRHTPAKGDGVSVSFGGTPGRFWSALDSDGATSGGDVQRPDNNAVVAGAGGGGQTYLGGLSTYSGNGGNGAGAGGSRHGSAPGGGGGASDAIASNGGAGSVRIWYIY